MLNPAFRNEHVQRGPSCRANRYQLNSQVSLLLHDDGNAYAGFTFPDSCKECYVCTSGRAPSWTPGSNTVGSLWGSVTLELSRALVGHTVEHTILTPSLQNIPVPDDTRGRHNAANKNIRVKSIGQAANPQSRMHVPHIVSERNKIGDRVQIPSTLLIQTRSLGRREALTLPKRCESPILDRHSTCQRYGGGSSCHTCFNVSSPLIPAAKFVVV